MKRKHMIFVFGSNLSGIHGAGAAKTALTQHGAKWGAGEGLMGTSYALPTKGIGITFMDASVVRSHVENFCDFAIINKHATFLVTQVGCGLGGFTKEEIAPMFIDMLGEVPANLRFDEAWKPLLPVTAKFWGTFP